MFALLALSAALVAQFSASQAHAGKEVFVRTKPHVNVGTLGQVKPQQPMIAPALGNGSQAGDGGPGGPRKDKIDLSVCELGTFDHGKCLGGE
ncbi:MAG TPA: hypothetical protein VK862_06345 [Afifellaceae bacterium]|nr:hypothetical protein [Afifellaceae bacterium]